MIQKKYLDTRRFCYCVLVFIVMLMFLGIFRQTTYADVVTATITTGTEPDEIALNPVTNKIYVANYSSSSQSITVIDGVTNTTKNIDLGYQPYKIVVNPVTNRIYVLCEQYLNTKRVLKVIDGINDTVSNMVILGTDVYPNAIAIDSVLNKIYITDNYNNKLWVCDQNGVITETITAGANPTAIMVDPISHWVYVLCANGNSPYVSIIGVGSCASGTHPSNFAKNPVTNTLYISSSLDTNTVTVVNTSTVQTINNISGRIVVNPVTNKIYVASSDVKVIDGATNAVETITTLNGTASAIAVNPSTNKIYVTNGTTNTLTVIDGATNAVQTLTTGSTANSIAINPVTNKIYVPNSKTNNVTVVDDVSYIPQSIAALSSPTAIEENPVTNKIYAISRSGKQIMVMDEANNTSQSVPVEQYPNAIAMNLVTNKIYVSAEGQVIALDGNSNNNQTISIGDYTAYAMAVNPLTNKIYVACDDKIAVIDGDTYAVRTLATWNNNIEHNHSIAVNVATNKIYAVNYNDGSLLVIDGVSETIQTVALGVNTYPETVAINPVTNRIYVLTANGIVVVDGASNSTQLIPLWNSAVKGIHTMGINSITNKIYLPFDNKIVILNGADNTTKTLDIGENYPFTAVVNQATNRIYFPGNMCLIILDGFSNMVQTVSAGAITSSAIVVNPFNNQIYLTDNNNAKISIVRQSGGQEIPLSVSIIPQSGVINFIATSSSTPTPTNPSHIYYQVDTWTGNWLPVTPDGISGYTLTSSLSPGIHTIYAFAVDGEESASVNQHGILIGKIKAYDFLALGTTRMTPESDTGAFNNDGITNKTTPTFTGTAKPNAMISIYLDNSTTPTTTTVTDSSGTWSWTVDSPLSEGNHIFGVMDSSAGIGSLANTSFAIDTTAPSTPGIPVLASTYDSGISNSDHITNKNKPTFSGSGAASYDTWYTLYDGSVAIATVRAYNNYGNWSWTSPNMLPDKVYALSVTQTDLAGNVSAPSGVLNVTIDTTGPGFSSIKLLSPSPTKGPEVTYRVTFNEAVLSVHTLDFNLYSTGTAAGNISSVSADSGTTVDVTVNSVSGTGTLKLGRSYSTDIVDLAGNAMPNGSYSDEAFQIDNTGPSVKTINRLSPSTTTTNSTSVTYRVTFNEAVTGVDAGDFSLSSPDGTVSGTIVGVISTDPTIFDVTVNSISGSGTLRLDLKSSGTGITDLTANPVSGGFTGGALYTFDMTRPTVLSIKRLDPAESTTHLPNVTYQVTFSENVTGVDVSDFSVTCTSGTASGIIASVSASSGSTVNVSVNSITGIGDLRLDLKSSAGINDTVGNTINGGFTTGQIYTIDPVPYVNAINRLDPVAQLTNATTVIYRVIFSETVSGVDKSDFSLTSPDTATGVIDSVSTLDGVTFDVKVTQIKGNGSLRLDLKNSGTGILDVTNNPIGVGFTAGDTYMIDNTLPSVYCIVRSNPVDSLTKSTQVQFWVSFTKNVTGVDISDFELTCTGTATGTIKSVSAASGNSMNVTVDGISGTGTLRLDLKDTGTEIKDGAGNTINGGFQYGAVYTIDNTPPTVLSIKRLNPIGQKTNATSVIYRVTFDESVSGVDKTDFSLSGTPTGTITAVSAYSENTFDVTASSIAGQGLLGLNLKDSGTGITDAVGNLIKTGFTTGETYDIDNTKPTVTSIARENPIIPLTNSNTLTYLVTFSKEVISVDVTDFVLTSTGTATGTPMAVSGKDSGLTYEVTIDRISGNGTLRLDLKGSTDIRDLAGNLCSGFTGGEPYTIDMMVPVVLSLNRENPVTATANSLNSITYRINFSEDIEGVDINDFTLTKTGTAKGTISAVSSDSGIARDITITNINGSGTLRLDLKSSGTGITDTIGNLISGGFTGETYTITSTAPAPVFSPNSGNNSYNIPQYVTVTCDLAGATIRYTTNGSEPTTASPVVNSGGTILVNKSMTLKAKAWMTNWQPSPTTTASYIINIPDAPTFSIKGGMYATSQTVTINCATPGAIIYYTIDGSDPSSEGNNNRKKCTTGAKVTFKMGITTLRAIAYSSSLATVSSPESMATYTITTVVPTPVITSSRTFKGSLSVYISCTNDSNAKIYYTTNGSTPTMDSTQYSGTAITVNETTTITAIAYEDGKIPSKVVRAIYTATVADPSLILPQGPTYTEAQKVTVTCPSSDAEIHYTTNGSTPTVSSPVVKEDGITLDHSMTIKVKAFKTGWIASGVVSGIYKLSYIAPPVFSPQAGYYPSPQNVTISCPTPGALIKYTTDGSEPANGKDYKAGNKILLGPGNPVLRAYAYKTGVSGSSSTANYTIESPIATPTFELDPNQIYTEEKMITVQCATKDAVIRFTVNGAEPTPTSPIFPEGGILLNKNLTVKTKAYKSGWVTSATATASYKTSFVATPTFGLSEGIYSGNQTTTISCATTGAVIKYTTDGSDPSNSPTVKTYKTGAKILLPQGTNIIRAYAFKSGLIVTGSTNEAEYIIIGTLVVPVFKPTSKSFVGSLAVEMSCANPQAKIYYTTDGSTPTPDSHLYSDTQKPTVYKTTTIKARVFLDGWIPSNIVSATYTSTDKAANLVWQDLGTTFGNGAVRSASELRVYQGIPYIAFVDGVSSKATVWSYSTNTWGPLGQTTVSDGNANYLKLFNVGNKLYLSYADESNGNKATIMKYDSSWSSVATGFSEHEILENSLYVYNNKPYLAFQDRLAADGSQDYASIMWQDSSWKYIGGEGCSNTGINLISLAVYKGKPYVIYSTTSGDVEVKYYNSSTGIGSSWTGLGVLSATGVLSKYTKICLDTTGMTYVLYNDYAQLSGKMVVKKYISGKWTTLPAVSEVASLNGDLFMDGNTLYITYFDSSANMIYIKKFSSGVWVTVGGEGISTGGSITSLSIFVENGTPYVQYLQNNSITIKRAK